VGGECDRGLVGSLLEMFLVSRERALADSTKDMHTTDTALHHPTTCYSHA
jgi:hypothetical protein